MANPTLNELMVELNFDLTQPLLSREDFLDALKSRGDERFVRIRSALGSGETSEGLSENDIINTELLKLIQDAWTNSILSNISESERRSLFTSLATVPGESLRGLIYMSIFKSLSFEDVVRDTRIFLMMLDSIPSEMRMVTLADEMPEFSRSLLIFRYIQKMKKLNYPIDLGFYTDYFLKSFMTDWTPYWKSNTSRADSNDSFSYVIMTQLLSPLPMEIYHREILNICNNFFAVDKTAGFRLFKHYLDQATSKNTSPFSGPTFSNVIALMKCLEPGVGQVAVLNAVLESLLYQEDPHAGLSNSWDLEAENIRLVLDASTGEYLDFFKMILDPKASIDGSNKELLLKGISHLKDFQLTSTVSPWVESRIVKLLIENNPQFTVEDLLQVNDRNIQSRLIRMDYQRHLRDGSRDDDRVIDMIVATKGSVSSAVYELGSYVATLKSASLEVGAQFYVNALQKFPSDGRVAFQKEFMLGSSSSLIWKPTEKEISVYLKYLIETLRMSPEDELNDPGFIYQSLKYIPKDILVSMITSFSKDIYPNSEAMQLELFKCLLRDRSPDLTADLKKTAFTSFATQINDDFVCIDLIRDVIRRGGRMSERLSSLSPEDNSLVLFDSEILEITEKKAPIHFQSLKNQLNSITLGEALSQEKFDVLNAQFDFMLYPDTPLLGLFTYYDLIEEPGTLLSMLNADTLKMIKASYECPEDRAFITSKEYLKLLRFNIPEPPKMTSLCTYLKSRQDSQLKIPPLKDSIKYLMTWLTAHLGDLKDSEKKPEFIAKMCFLKLLKMGDKADDDEVLKFFEKITGQKFPHEKKKLFSLYSERKAELAYLFGLPNGINDYIEILRGISDGCIANIGTKTNIYLLGKLFKSETDQVVFPFFINKIFTPYANQGDDILGSRVEGTSVFQTPAILSLYLSPPALIQGLADELADDPKKSATIIQSLTNKDEFDSFQDNIFCFEDQAEAESLQARLASYLIVREIMKDELKNDHFRSPTETLTPLLSEDFSLDSYRDLQNQREKPSQDSLGLRG